MAMMRMAKASLVAAMATLALLAGCDDQKIKELEEGVSTEENVRAQFGVPETIWQEPDGSRTFEYPRQPMGARNYMITIGTDGKMSSLRQVLAPHNFEKIQPGMTQEQIRRMLGKPAKMMPYQLKQTEEWYWNWIDPPTRQMQLTVVFGPDRLVQSSYSAEKLHDGP